jgi:membrane glycosyltransferase
MLTLFGLTGMLLLAPKAMSIASIVLRGEAGRFGGTTRLVASAFGEFLHSLLLAPVRMLFHSQFVLATLTGWKLDWKSPPRDDAATRWREAAARHGVHTLLAIGWIAAIVATSATFPWWLSPIIAGLLSAIPLSVLTSRSAIGRALRRRGLMLTPEEFREPPVLRAARAAAADVAASADASLQSAVLDPEVHARVAAAVPPRGLPRGAKAEAEARLVERALHGGPGALGAGDRLRLLSSRCALALVRREVLAGRADPAWGSVTSPEAAPADTRVASEPVPEAASL